MHGRFCLTALCWFVAIELVCISGCGDWPPIVDSGDDILHLPVDQQSIRARGLANADVPKLKRLRQLRILDFSGGNAVMEAQINDVGLERLAGLNLPHLETLTLGWCDNITDAGLAHIGTMPTIKYLGLTACPKITDAGLLDLAKSMSLTGLDLRGCPQITDDGIQQLAAKANWEDIHLGGCPKITANGVAKLQAALPNARVKKDEQEWKWTNGE